MDLRYHRSTTTSTGGVDVDSAVLNLMPCPALSADIDLRPYQQRRWTGGCRRHRTSSSCRPRGGRRTSGCGQSTQERTPFVVVPTLYLVDQLVDELQTFDVTIGQHTGREKQVEPIPVSTYDSAYNHAGDLGNRFKLVR